jgi:hypothetical protein
MNYVKVRANGMFWTIAVEERRTVKMPSGRTDVFVYGRWFVPGAGWTGVAKWHLI